MNELRKIFLVVIVLMLLPVFGILAQGPDSPHVGETWQSIGTLNARLLPSVDAPISGVLGAGELVLAEATSVGEDGSWIRGPKGWSAVAFGGRDFMNRVEGVAEALADPQPSRTFPLEPQVYFVGTGDARRTVGQSMVPLVEGPVQVNVPEGGFAVVACFSCSVDGVAYNAATENTIVVSYHAGNPSDGSTPGDLNRVVAVDNYATGRLMIAVVYDAEVNPASFVASLVSIPEFRGNLGYELRGVSDGGTPIADLVVDQTPPTSYSYTDSGLTHFVPRNSLELDHGYVYIPSTSDSELLMPVPGDRFTLVASGAATVEARGEIITLGSGENGTHGNIVVFVGQDQSGNAYSGGQFTLSDYSAGNVAITTIYSGDEQPDDAARAAAANMLTAPGCGQEGCLTVSVFYVTFVTNGGVVVEERIISSAAEAANLNFLSE